MTNDSKKTPTHSFHNIVLLAAEPTPTEPGQIFIIVLVTKPKHTRAHLRHSHPLGSPSNPPPLHKQTPTAVPNKHTRKCNNDWLAADKAGVKHGLVRME